MTDMIRIIKGILLGAMLVVSTIAVFWSDGMAYWNDMAFIVWCLSIVLTIDMIEKKCQD